MGVLEKILEHPELVLLKKGFFIIKPTELFVIFNCISTPEERWKISYN